MKDESRLAKIPSLSSYDANVIQAEDLGEDR